MLIFDSPLFSYIFLSTFYGT